MSMGHSFSQYYPEPLYLPSPLLTKEGKKEGGMRHVLVVPPHPSLSLKGEGLIRPGMALDNYLYLPSPLLTKEGNRRHEMRSYKYCVSFIRDF